LEHEAALHEAVRRPRHQRYLAGAGEAERWAIVALRQGRLCADRKQYTQAQQFYAEAERGLPEEGEQLRAQLRKRWDALGDKLYEDNLLDAALTAYQRAALLDPEHPWPHNGIGNVYGDQGAWEAALTAYQQALERCTTDKDRAVVTRNIGEVYRRQGDYPQALATCQRALELDPTYWRGHNGIGLVHEQQGAWEAALTAYQQALEHCTSARDRAEVTTNIGNVYRRQGDYPQAVATCQRALELDPNYWRGHNGIGLVHEQQGAWEAALTAFQQALEHCTSARDRAEVTTNIGEVYYLQGNNAQALQTYQRALELDPNLWQAHANIGLVYAAQGAWEPARAAFLQATRLAPNDGSLHVCLANVCYHLGDREAGDHHLALARPLMEKETEYNCACFEAVAGNHRAALDLLRVALEKAPGMMEWAQHDPDFAALRDDPEFRALVGIDPPATAPGAE
jgi:tetratricopeptide (TPR) repeat protein